MRANNLSPWIGLQTSSVHAGRDLLRAEHDPPRVPLAQGVPRHDRTTYVLRWLRSITPRP
jgi:hypothetical protein